MISSSDARDFALDIPLDSSRDIVFPLSSDCEELPAAQKFDTRKNTLVPPERRDFQYNPVKESKNCASVIRDRYMRQQGSTPSHARQESFEINSLRPNKEHVNRRLLDGRGETINLPFDSTNLEATEIFDPSRIPSSPEDEEVVEVRKDSALFLEEAEGLPSIRGILKNRAPRIVRSRRESSGYASSLGSFDDDRRNSSIDVLQDLSSFFVKERSPAKTLNSRISRAEESLAEEIANSGADRMPTSEMYRKVSSAGLEMPNIEEVKEVLRDETSSRQESLCNHVKRLGAEELSAHCRFLRERTNRAVPSDESSGKTNILDTSKTGVTSKLRELSRDVFDTTSLNESITSVPVQPVSSPSSRNSLNRMVHQCSVPSSSTADAPCAAGKIVSEKPYVNEYVEVGRSSPFAEIPTWLEDAGAGPTRLVREDANVRGNESVFPRPVKVYQLLSTQSEDQGDGEPRMTDRRISLQISKPEQVLPFAESEDVSAGQPNVSALPAGDLKMHQADGSPVRKLSSPDEVGPSQRFLGDAPNVTVRPIYPYYPYSPYGSPQGSPRNRRRPLRESRRVSIDNRQGALQLNQYKLLDNIGQGSYGIVKLVYNEEDETHYAMKILSKKKLMKKAGIFGRMAPGRKGAANPLAKVYREIALLKKLDHPNVVKLVEVLDDPDEDNLYLVFELVQKGEVLQIPAEKPLDEETARKNFRDVVMGVEYLHYQRIVHRDIKPSNLLVDSDGRIKIADLGVSAELRASGELLSGPAGTPAFTAPETTTPGAYYSGTLCDIWSMGVTLYSFVTGRVPWYGTGSVIGVQAAVRTEPLKFPERPVLSADLRHLISRMLEKDPEQRIGLAEIKEHPWLTNGGTEPLPSEADNCRLPVTVTDEEVERVVTRVPKLDTLILIKTMLKQHSFQNPFLPKKGGKSARDTVTGSLELSGSDRVEESVALREIRNVKSEQFQRAGRSNSAPDSFDWQANGRQISVESPLPPVTEASSQEAEVDRR